MNETVAKKDIVTFAVIVLAMFGSLAYGYFSLKSDKPKNCWDNYATENEAIINCEGELQD